MTCLRDERNGGVSMDKFFYFRVLGEIVIDGYVFFSYRYLFFFYVEYVFFGFRYKWGKVRIILLVVIVNYIDYIVC